MNTRDPKKPAGSRFPVRKIPPSHDYIRQHGSGPKDGWAKGPSDPGLGPEARDQQPPAAGQPPTAPAPPRPLYGDVHKFGYTRPLKKHEEAALAASGPGARPDGAAGQGGAGGHADAPPISKNAPTYSYLYSNGEKFGYGQPSPKERPPAGAAPSPESGAEPPPGIEPPAEAAPDPELPGAEPPPTPSPPFVHLHVHSNFSFLDGGSRIEELVVRAAELGQPALALTDHDGLYGAVRFAKACGKRGIKPVFGAEVRVESLLPPADDQAAPDPVVDTAIGTAAAADPHHLVLLAETREGYANLCRLISAAHLADPEREHPPLVTVDSLRTHADGLICLTGCRHGEVGHLVDAGRDSDARAALLRLRDIFGGANLYVELQYFGYEPHQEAYAGQHGTKVVKKAPAIGNRLRHQEIGDSPPADAPPAPQIAALPSHNYCNATSIASTTARKTTPRPDLPQGHPHRLNPSDYDVGFHRDDRPWRLSCLIYCLRLAALARTFGLPTVLTTNAHYARGADRAIHLICRAAGHDKPLSGYPDLDPGARCLKSKTEIEALAAPLLEFLAQPDGPPAEADPPSMSQSRCNAIPIAFAPMEKKPCSSWVSCIEIGKASRSTDIALPVYSLRNVTSATSVASAPPKPAAPAPSPLAATADIAARCTVDLELGTYHFPQIEVPRGETAYSLLAKRCFRGIARKYRPVPPRAVELLEKELRMIQQMGFAHYFLVVHDIVRWARAKGVACSGRGSAGNSIVCHALDITASEPIRHNLLFERFLNPNRREMPDIDVDFCSSRRDEVIEHIYKTFGNQNVAVVANINTMSPRSAVRIVAEALGYAPTEINALAKHVPRHGDSARIREYLTGAWPELRESPLQDEGRYGRLLDLVERLNSFPMHLGTHLGGFVITDRPITYYAPLQWAAKGVVVIQFNKDDVAALGLVKMDILGLRTHSAVSETCHIVRQRTGRRIRPYDLPPDDPAAYEIISNGGSIGLFQLESAGQRNLASRLQERDFDDVIAAIALYRPGPLEAEMIGPFIDRRWGLEPVVLPHPDMRDAVSDTYGVILYQEQVLRIAQSVAGFDLADADSLRRAMTRDRSREEMAKIGETFIGGAIARGVPEAAAREVFRQLEGFAAYGFNKSHSVCFAVISYATAWLKAYYPAEFLCSVLNNYPMGFYTPRTVLNDARRFGLEVRPIDINLSGRGFTVEDVVPPDPWIGAAGAPDGESDLFGVAATGVGAASARTAGCAAAPYNPFAQAWTADHDWGLTDADLAELAAEQDGDQVYAEAMRAALEHGAPDEAPRTSGATTYVSSAPMDGVRSDTPPRRPEALQVSLAAGDPASAAAALAAAPASAAIAVAAIAAAPLAAAGQVESDHPTDDDRDGDEPHRRGRLAEGQDADRRGACRPDAGPHGVRGTNGDRPQREVQQHEAGEREDGEADRGPQVAEAVAQLEKGGEPDLTAAGKQQEHPSHYDPSLETEQATSLYPGSNPSTRPRPGDLLLGTLRTLAARDNAGHLAGDSGQAGGNAGDSPDGGTHVVGARSPRSRAGVEPGACLAPSTGIAPDAGRALRVGLSYLKQMGDRSLDRIEQERRHGPFESFEDFYLRTRVDYPVAENLIRVGAFDSLEPDRTELLWRLPLLRDRLEALAGSSGARRGQLRAFFSPPDRAGLMRSWTLEDKVRSELELLGLTVSCHPLELYEDELRRMGVRMSYELPAMGDEVPVTVAGVYERAQNPWMRSGKRTMFLTLEDAYGLFECVCFESKLAKIAPVVARASYFLVRGRLQNNHKRGLAIVAEDVFDLEEVLARRAARQKPAAGNAARPSRGDGRSRAGHPEAAPGAGTRAIPKKVG